jgi:CBS domain-containing protein
MRARDLAERLPTVDLDTDAMEAARTLASHRIPGLVVLDEDGGPYAVLPGSQVLRFVIPSYVQEDPQLAGVYDEATADELCGQLAGRPVRDLLPRRPDPDDLPVVEGSANSMVVAALMARLRSPIVAVVDHDAYLGAITASHLLEHLLLDQQR